MTAVPAELRYILELVSTVAGTGAFAPIPEGRPELSVVLERLRNGPQDSFLHRYALEIMAGRSAGERAAMLGAVSEQGPVLEALLAELALLEASPNRLNDGPGKDDMQRLSSASPLVLLRHGRLEDRAPHAQWSALMAANLSAHQPLPGDDRRPRLPAFESGNAVMGRPVGLEDVPPARDLPCTLPVSLDQTIETALTRLEGAGILVSAEMRHEASLSPVGLMRQWRFQRRVRSGSLVYRLGGFQTAYGRGFRLDAARAAYLMEIVERFSAYGEFEPEALLGHRRATPLVRASLKDMRTQALSALDPNRLLLEVPYENEPLYWRPAELVDSQGRREIWVPAQCVYLFCNLDEPDLFSALGSTGLGAGNTPAQARLAALLEIIERDGEAITPFDPGGCFTVESTDPYVQSLLSHYRRCGIHVQFQDLTTELGVPCYKCFVVGSDGRIAKGTGAHPQGRRALLSALTETMHPYPNGPVSKPGLEALPVRTIENLPDYGLGSNEADLNRLERLLNCNGFQVVYADLTREDLDLPVVRALVPGLALMADYDRFTRLNPRLIKRLVRCRESG